MRYLALALALFALGTLTSEAFAQQGGGCARGGGGAAPAAGPEGARTFSGALITQTEFARQYFARMQQQEMARNFCLQMHRNRQEEAQRLADAAEEKRQMKIDAIKERRAEELARREARRARNLARRAGVEEVATHR